MPMLQHRIVIALALLVLTTLLSIFTNIATGNQGMMAWLAWVLIVLCLMAAAVFTIRQLRLEHAATTSQPAVDTNRIRMLNKVESYWIHSVLDRSLERVTWLELGLQHTPNAVTNPLELIHRRPGYDGQAIPPGTRINDVFDKAGRELLILGAPGAGKTTLLLELTRDLIAQARRETDSPIPVVFNLSSWATKRPPPLRAWLVTELNERYGVPWALAEQWVKDKAVLPLLDGLDEVAQAHRAVCIAAINAFRQDAGLLPIAVCSRSGDYAELTAKLRLNHAVEVQPLSRQQVETYLEVAGPPLASIRTLLHDDPDFWELLHTPLMLSIVSLAYRDQSAPTMRASTVEERRTRVFRDYVKRMFAHRGGRLPAPAEYVCRWLCWLARQLVQRQQKEFQIERIQPNWLPEGTQWIPTLGVSLGVGLVVGLCAGWFTDLVSRQSVLRYNGLFGLLAGLIYGWMSLPIDGQPAISPVDTVRVDWSRVFNRGCIFGQIGLVGGLIFGLVGGLVGLVSGLVGLVFGWTDGLIGLGVWLVRGLFSGVGIVLFSVLINALLFVPFGVLSSVSITTTMRPNEGIRRSLLNACVVSLVFGLYSGLPIFLFFWLVIPSHTLYGLSVGLGVGLSVGLVGWLRYGGSVFLRHSTLRLILWRLNLLPLNLVPFLDACVERILLRRVGGGYIFVHRLLMEHLAAMTPEQAAQLVGDEAGRGRA